MRSSKPFDIPKELVNRAFKLVKANKGGPGIDCQTLEQFEAKLEDNLYKLWNRLSSGTYFPPSVKAVPIPKKNGGVRILGIPTVEDRIAQTVVQLCLEPEVEPYFLPDSYGYRPNKSAIDAIKITRERCWKYDWVLEFDIKGLFDNIDHELLMKAVKTHTSNRWILLYIERWIKAPLQLEDERQIPRNTGTPQGGVISPVLANLFLHYAFDTWMKREVPSLPWCRYADDGLVHCSTETQALWMKDKLAQRMKECKLELHPEKTRVIYCKDQKRAGNHTNIKFDFLGYCFRPRVAKSSKTNRIFTSFLPAVANSALKAMRQRTRAGNWRNRTNLELHEIARACNPVLRGWLQYYGQFYSSQLSCIWEHFDRTLAQWAIRKYKSFRNSLRKGLNFIKNIARSTPNLFVHWQQGRKNGFA